MERHSFEEAQREDPKRCLCRKDYAVRIPTSDGSFFWQKLTKIPKGLFDVSLELGFFRIKPLQVRRLRFMGFEP